MKTLVIGATGATGRALTNTLLERGHEVTAFTRNADAVEAREGLRVVVGDVMRTSDVEAAVKGHDAVVVALGIRENPLLVRLRGASRTATDVRSRGTHNVIEAMRKHGVRRLVVQGTYGVFETFARLSWLWKAMFRLLLWPQLLDTQRQESRVRQSDLDWVLVRPVALKDRERSGALVSREGDIAGMNVSRLDVVDVLAEATAREEYVGEAWSVSAA